MPTRARRPSRRGFGKLRRLPSKRWQASYVGPDEARHSAPTTFESKMDGEAWLAAERQLLATQDWLPPAQRSRRGLMFKDYSARWVAARELKPSTRALYRGILRRVLLPA